jgi:hypothetical protein
VGTLENGDHANFVFAFFRPHVTSMSVLNTHSQPQTANPRIITTNQMALNVVMRLSFAPSALRIGPLSIRFVMVMDAGSRVEIKLTHYPRPSFLDRFSPRQ